MTSTDMRDNQAKAIVVEDTKTWQDIFKTPLEEDLSLTVTVASSLEEAEFHINQEFYHLAVLDLALDPENDANRDGMKILQHLNDLDDGTVRILISGIGTMEIGYEAGLYGALSVLEKGKFKLEEYVPLIIMGLDRANQNISAKSVGVDFLAGPEPIVIWTGNVIGALNTHGYQPLDRFAKSLLNGMNPFLRYKQEPGAILDAPNGVVTINLWSKMLRSAILVKFGKRSAIEPESAGQNLIRTHESGDLFGVVQTTDLAFDDFDLRAIQQNYFPQVGEI